jgi:hypothetical protein
MNQPKNPGGPSSIDTGGGASTWAGTLRRAAASFVGRDDFSMTVAPQGASREEFAQLLAEFGRMLAEAGLPEKTARIIESDVKVVQDESTAPKPDAASSKAG